MSLATFIDRVADRRKLLTVYGPDRPDDLSALFATWNVTVEYQHLSTAPGDSFVTVHEGGEFLGGVSAASLASFGSPNVHEPWDESFSEESYRALMSLLDDTLFFSGRRRQLLATSREFEERAWRLDAGALHAAFQSEAAFRDQTAVYERLAGESALDVHVYLPSDWKSVEVPPDWVPADDAGIRWHPTDAEEIGETWVVAYDGGGADEMKCALVAVERWRDEYRGCWTYDPGLVDEVTGYLTEQYG